MALQHLPVLASVLIYVQKAREEAKKAKAKAANEAKKARRAQRAAADGAAA